MPEIDPVILQLRAEVKQYQNEIRATTTLVSRQLDQQERSIIDLEHQIRSSSASMSSSLKGLAGSLAGYFSAQQVLGMIDAFTSLQNKLRVAGVEGGQLAQVQDRLFASAQKYGVEINALGGLFGSLTQASKELGATQGQVFQLTDAVSAALKVSGSSAGEAAGALQQLGQAFRSPKIQAEEYNSLLDGLFPLLQAAADGSDKYAGSVGKLTAAVKNGDVTNREFFDIILRGADALEKRATKGALTLSAGMTQLTNALTVYVGGAASANGVSGALAAGLSALADNIDVIIPAIAIVGTALGVGFVANAARAAFAARATGVAMLSAFGGPVGLAITALTLGIGAFASEAVASGNLVEQANTAYDEMRQRLAAANEEAGKAANGAAGVGSAASGAVPGVDSLTGSVKALADQLFRQADAAKQARIETAASRLAEARRVETELGKRLPQARGDTSQFRRGDLLANAGALGRYFVGGGLNLLSGGRKDQEAREAYGRAVETSRQAKRDLDAAYLSPNGGSSSGRDSVTLDTKAIAKHEATLAGLRRRLASAKGKEVKTVQARIKREESILTDLRKGVDTAEATAAAPGIGAGGGGKNAETEAKRKREEQQRIQSQIADAQVGYLSELAQTTQNASERAEIEQQVVERTRAANELDIRNNEALSDAQRNELIGINNKVAALRKTQIEQREQDRVRQQALTLTQDALRSEDSLLQLQSGLAATQRERRSIELRRLDIAERLERAGLNEELAAATIAGDTTRIAAARKRLADLEERAPLERERVNRDTESPLAAYRRGVKEQYGDLQTSVENIEVSALQAVSSELEHAAVNALGLSGALGDVVGQIIQIGIQRRLIGPLADALFGKADGSNGSGAIGGTLTSIIGAIGGRASGGYVAPNSLVRVNEGRGMPELLRMGGQGGEVIPLGRVNAVANRAQRGGNTYHISVSADNSVTPAGFAQDLAGRILSEARRMDQVTAATVQRSTPGYLSQSQKLSG